jgi:hypothetical protein
MWRTVEAPHAVQEFLDPDHDNRRPLGRVAVLRPPGDVPKAETESQWQVDRREDDSVKHLQLLCKDGAALLAYSGLAKVGNDHISDCLRRLVRGQSRTVDETLIRIREQATATLAGPAATARIPHAFVIGTFVQGQPWVVAIVNQERPDSSAVAQFRTEGLAADQPKALIVGKGRDAVSDEDRALVERVAKRRPKRPEDYSRAPSKWRDIRFIGVPGRGWQAAGQGRGRDVVSLWRGWGGRPAAAPRRAATRGDGPVAVGGWCGRSVCPALPPMRRGGP